MKGTDIFKRTIHTYLVKRAASDELFAQSFASPDKSVELSKAFDNSTFLLGLA